MLFFFTIIHQEVLIFSKEDIELTKKFNTVLKPLEIRVLDHILVANASGYSMKENGEWNRVEAV